MKAGAATAVEELYREAREGAGESAVSAVVDLSVETEGRLLG